ncbi:MAG: AI-2E family transporter, partial [Pseudomonadota bacterium]|nr:AI-2E family transporter [Pseudomonadota bacterium]
MSEDASPSQASRTERNANVVIAVVVVGAALYWLRDIVTPFALAFFLLIMIDGLERLIRERAPRLPGWAPLTVAMGLILVAFGASVYVVATEITSLFGQMIGTDPASGQNNYAGRVNNLIRDVATLLGLDAPPTLRELFRQLNPQRYLGSLVGAIQALASDALFILIYLGFLLASRRGFQAKARALFGSREERKEAGRIFDEIRAGAQGYLWIQTVTGAMIALGCWVLMLAVGLDHALFWAFFIFLTGYIPIVGPAVGTVLPAVFGLVQYDSYWPPLIVLAGNQAINFFVGNVIYPRMQARGLNVDPVVVLLSLAFWSALWGLTGAFLSTPLTVVAMVLLAQFNGSRWVAILLSQNGNPDPKSDHAAPPSREAKPPKSRPLRLPGRSGAQKGAQKEAQGGGSPGGSAS